MKQYVVFGDDAVSRVLDSNWKEAKKIIKDEPSSFGKREFVTDAERLAYVCGLEDAVGWMEVYPLTDEEVEELKKHARLSDIHDLSSNY